MSSNPHEEHGRHPTFKQYVIVAIVLFAITLVELSPRISFGGSPPDSKTLDAIHDESHRECFIANSVLTEITVRSEK